ncbi:hypothetical protein ACOMHN_028190 [Nucella lapillus]
MASRRRGSKDTAGGLSKGANVKASASTTVAIVGDVGVGKTCLLLSYLSGKYPTQHLEGPADWHSEYDHLTRHPVKVEQDGVEVSMSLVDTCGLDEYQKLREKMCPSADAFVICFDVTSPTSLERVKDQWLPEIKEYNSAAPFVLVATKCDERIKAQIEGKPSSATVSFSQAKALAQELGAKTYCESSAKNMTGVRKVFDEAALASLQNAFPGGVDKRSSCVVS